MKLVLLYTMLRLTYVTVSVATHFDKLGRCVKPPFLS